MDPLLSIYIPTYNSAHLLVRMLEALLPQTEPWGNKVEVIVSDNASDDNTQILLSEFAARFTLNYVRNDTNLGPIKNIVRGPSELARGEYVWVLGSHNLGNLGAIDYLIPLLERERERFKIFYVNFNCATYPQQWTEEATGGFRGEITYIANQETADRVVEKWQELVKPETSLCTQMYAYIVKTSVWIDYWRDKTLGEPYTDAISTYPHSVMIADTLFKEPTYYIGTPLITIYNGAQSWGDLDTRLKVYCIGLPDLIKLYRKNGLPASKNKQAQRWNQQMAKPIITSYFRECSSSANQLVWTLVIKNLSRYYLLKTIWKGYLGARAQMPAKIIVRSQKLIGNLYRYFFFSWRPARWLRSKTE